MKTIHLVFFLCILVISTIVFLYRWNWYIDRLDTIKIKNDIIEENKNSYLFGYLVDSPPCSGKQLNNCSSILFVVFYFKYILLV